jgi:hypothetical protein
VGLEGYISLRFIKILPPEICRLIAAQIHRRAMQAGDGELVACGELDPGAPNGGGSSASCDTQAGGLSNIGPFSNVQSSNYWPGTGLDSSNAWNFNFNNGNQNTNDKNNNLFAWAVHSGE